MKTDKLLKALRKVQLAENKFSSECGSAAEEFCKYVDFETSEDMFFIDFQPSDGVVLADKNSKVYELKGILLHIQKFGKFKHYEELEQYAI